jgi:predicted Fe-S protein YdhL (DUF1289 family)
MGVLNKPLTPCIGNCTTTFGGLYCKSCGRTLSEINDWHKYSDDMKLKIMKRLEDEGYGGKKVNYTRPK